ncbi:hypothetical protein PtrSN002B_009436 [Pyrenophora tritici-repentis]|uniref:Uncharacterized protein n=2 Tax=Pyrenophora tritici-repentis TaxID=45151 RepID=A0A2W1EDA8_9PLEO|nr:uncharacterized protein PTRG_10247 [Pyrenophora tritici-repentis Pt-1C-BFP]KAA8620858.1 hypothetical protein PtrV1_05359 [Pyrenophora tritici-repentis]EDU43298.1 predicted protein [Pyrenophora tritici-repentis Pt-1C-BFP]KAF7450101.1 hypothetical protein A1F99_047170 [Pyrenophora tritici-repentis]KAF7572672.1 hypothetical protein PtrM4_075770 [Pyrenophora tritici-repentis]KAG9376075.1 hypothetical protein A1F94_013341 [Pyrenophora tritici-repentis]
MVVAEAHLALAPHDTAADDMTKQGAQATAASILAALPERTRSQPFDGSNGIGNEYLLQTFPPSRRASQAPQRESTTPSQHSTPSPCVTPEIVSSTFPSELPPRPPPKQSPLRRLFSLPVRPPTQAAQTDKNMTTNHTSVSRVDIEMGSLGVRSQVQHDLQNLARTNRRLKICVFVLVGQIIVMAGIMVVYVAYSHSATQKD